MDTSDQSDKRAIADLRRRWIAAMGAGDVGQLRQLMTEDVVVVHGSGLTVSGRETVARDLERYFATGSTISQEVEPQEVVVAGDWGFERALVRSSIRQADSGRVTEVKSNTWTLVRRGADGAWRVARTIGVIIQ